MNSIIAYTEGDRIVVVSGHWKGHTATVLYGFYDYTSTHGLMSKIDGERGQYAIPVVDVMPANALIQGKADR